MSIDYGVESMYIQFSISISLVHYCRQIPETIRHNNHVQSVDGFNLKMFFYYKLNVTLQGFLVLIE